MIFDGNIITKQVPFPSYNAVSIESVARETNSWSSLFESLSIKSAILSVGILLSKLVSSRTSSMR